MSQELLSGRELARYCNHADFGPPQKRGVKDYAPERDSWLQGKQLQHFYEEQSTHVHSERVLQLNSLSIGDWMPDSVRVEVRNRKGSFWKTMGHVEGKRSFLDPEEAVFLMDQGVLEIRYGGLPLSIQEAYNTLLGNHVRLPDYQVYAHLLRLGYIVIRHSHGLQVTEYERQIGLHQHMRMKRGKRQDNKKRPRSHVDNNNYKRICKEEKSDEADVLQDLSPERLNNGDEEEEAVWHDYSGIDSWTQRIESELGSQTSSASETPGGPQPIPYSNWDFNSIALPDCSGKDVVELCVPSKVLLPGSVSYSVESHLESPSEQNNSQSASHDRESHPESASPHNVSQSVSHSTETHLESASPRHNTESNLESASPHHVSQSVSYGVERLTLDVRQFRGGGKRPQDYEDNLEYSHGTVGWKAVVKGRNWAEYKRNYAERLHDSWLAVSPAAHLWCHGNEDDDDVTPLIRPEHATSTVAVLERLKIIENVNLTSKEHRLSTDAGSRELEIMYDVYLPSPTFRKSVPGLPNHRICVMEHSEGLPDVSQVMALKRSCPDGVPLHWAVLDHGAVAFYVFHEVDIPVDINIG